MKVDRKEQGNLIIENIPDIPERIVERIFQYQGVRSAHIYDWDPVGKGILISTEIPQAV